MHAAQFSTGADAPAPVDTTALAAGYARIIRTAHACGWRLVATRPRGTQAGDSAGAPNMLAVHGGAGRVWHLLLRRANNGRLTPDQQLWGETVTRAGGIWRAYTIPDDVDQLCVDLADAVHP